MATVTISPKFQVVIPKRLKLRSGQKVQAILYDDRIQLVPVRPAKAMKGFLKGIDTKLSIPMADSVILATARATDAVLWTQAADFATVPGVRYVAKKWSEVTPYPFSRVVHA